MEGKIDMPKEFSAEFLKGKDFEKIVGSFDKNRFYALQCISGKAKEIKDSLSNLDNPIYDDCNSFDEVCQAITNNCDGKLSGDSIIALAAKIAYDKGINPDDSCWDEYIEKNAELKRIGFMVNDVKEVQACYPQENLTESDWKFLLLSRSKMVAKIYRKAKKEDND